MSLRVNRVDIVRLMWVSGEYMGALKPVSHQSVSNRCGVSITVRVWFGFSVGLVVHIGLQNC